VQQFPAWRNPRHKTAAPLAKQALCAVGAAVFLWYNGGIK